MQTPFEAGGRDAGVDDARERTDAPEDEAIELTTEPAPAPVEAPPGEDPASLRDRWLRAEAEIHNVRRRLQREAEESRRSAEERVLLELIAALDDVERAIEAAAAAGAPASWIDGVRLTARRLTETLGRYGVPVIDPAGEPFDPRFHEAMLETPSDDVPAGHVLQVVLRGWRRHDRALRAARVVVARPPDAS
jgi:molecular chaperone GrpE